MGNHPGPRARHATIHGGQLVVRLMQPGALAVLLALGAAAGAAVGIAGGNVLGGVSLGAGMALALVFALRPRRD